MSAASVQAEIGSEGQVVVVVVVSCRKDSSQQYLMHCFRTRSPLQVAAASDCLLLLN